MADDRRSRSESAMVTVEKGREDEGVGTDDGRSRSNYSTARASDRHAWRWSTQQFSGQVEGFQDSQE